MSAVAPSGRYRAVRAVGFLPPLLVLGGLFVAWEALPALGVNPAIVPPLSSVLSILWEKRVLYADNLAVTLTEMALGFLAGFLIGLLAASAVAYTWVGRRVVNPLLVISQTIPVIALAPMLVILLGFGMEPRIIIVALGVLFPIALNTIAGFASTDQDFVRLLKSYSASRLTIFRTVELPSALPFIMTGVQIGVTYSIIGAVVAEWVGSGRGLGKLMLLRVSATGIELTYGSVVLTAAVALLLFGGVKLVRGHLVPWERFERSE